MRASSFVFFHSDAGVPAFAHDSLYIADGNLQTSNGGLLKYTFDAVAKKWVWVTSPTLRNVTPNKQLRGLAGVVNGSTVTPIATTTNGEIVIYVDDGVSAPSGTLFKPPTNTAYRGVAVAPQ